MNKLLIESMTNRSLAKWVNKPIKYRCQQKSEFFCPWFIWDFTVFKLFKLLQYIIVSQTWGLRHPLHSSDVDWNKLYHIIYKRTYNNEGILRIGFNVNWYMRLPRTKKLICFYFIIKSSSSARFHDRWYDMIDFYVCPTPNYKYCV